LRLAQDIAGIARQDDGARQCGAGNSDQDCGGAVDGDRPGMKGIGRPLIGHKQHRVPGQEHSIGGVIAQPGAGVKTCPDEQDGSRHQQFGGLRKQRHQHQSAQPAGHRADGTPGAFRERGADSRLREDIDRQRRPLRLAQFKPIGERESKDRGGGSPQ